MAHPHRQAAQRMKRPAKLLRTVMRQWLERPGGREALRQLDRSRWRVLRCLLLREEAPVVLVALLQDQLARRQLNAAPPEAWTVDQALAALAERSDVQLFGALRLLQATQPAKQRLGYAASPDAEGVRIDQTLLLGFAGSEVQELHVHRVAQTAGRVRVQQAAVGLLGPNGALPSAWTQYAHDLQNATPSTRSAERHSFVAFLNLVQRRQLALLYRAWSDAQAVVSVDPAPHDAATHPISGRLTALAGLAHAPITQRDSIPAAFKQAFAATLSRRVRSPGALAGMLSHYFDVPVAVEEFVSRWLEIPREQQTRLGSHFSVLGTDAVAGARVWNCTTCFCIVVGPLALARYQEFLPGGRAHREARDLVALYAGPEWDWEFRLVLQASEVPAGKIVGQGPAPQLGWTSWMGHRLAATDADDLRLTTAADLEPRAALAEAAD